MSKICKYTNIYPKEKVQKFLDDIKQGNVTITTERVSTSTNNVANEIDRVAYGYGYVDFGRENIIYNLKLKKKIIIWNEIVEHGKSFLEKALAYLIEIYLSIDEEKIFLNYKRLRNRIKVNNHLEYSLLTNCIDENLPDIGGFRRSVLDKWYAYLDFASADLISSYITGKKYIFHKRASFLNVLIKANNYTFEDLVRNKRNNNFRFLEQLIPREYCSKISLLSTTLENTDNSSRFLLTKYKLEIEMYRYISYLFYENKLQKFNEDDREDIIQKLLSQSHTLYNSDLKLDCGII